MSGSPRSRTFLSSQAGGGGQHRRQPSAAPFHFIFWAKYNLTRREKHDPNELFVRIIRKVSLSPKVDMSHNFLLKFDTYEYETFSRFAQRFLVGLPFGVKGDAVGAGGTWVVTHEC